VVTLLLCAAGDISALRLHFASLPGVSYQEYRENDEYDLSIAARQIRAALGAEK